MKRRSYRIPALVTQALLGLALAASTSYAQPSELTLDHFWCYIISSETPQPSVDATLTDQFFTAPGVPVKVGTPLQFCNPVTTKTVGGAVLPIFVNAIDHLTMYHLEKSPTLPTSRTLFASNQFGPQQQLTVDKATTLMVPTQKDSLGTPEDLDHFLCYPVSGDSLAKTVTLTDQFQTQNVIVEAPTLFCNPVMKTIGGITTEILNPDAHLLCYDIRLPKATTARHPQIVNQLETDSFTVTSTPMLCVPSTKTVVR
jgi:hypothetical protein